MSNETKIKPTRAPKYNPQPGDVLRPISKSKHAGRRNVIVVERRYDDGDCLFVRRTKGTLAVLSFDTWNDEYEPMLNEIEVKVHPLTEEDVRRIAREEARAEWVRMFNSIGANR